MFEDSQKALASRINDFAASKFNEIDDGPLKNALGGFVGTAFPGALGTIPDMRDNVFSGQIQGKIQASQQEQREQIQRSYKPVTDNLSEKRDWRARLRPKAGGEDQFYSRLGMQDYLLKPIKDSGGLVWQYTPTMFLSGSAEYNQALAQGMNYPINTFINGRAPDLPVTADFTANDIYEARYLLAVMTFLRVASKAYFGDTAVATGRYGTPPPVLLFEYLGEHGFHEVPVVVTNYTMELPGDVDYVPVETGIGSEGGEVTYVPTKSNITVNLTPTYTPHKLRRRFDLESISNGRAYKDGFI
jgi:hypothetical protein